jgi:nicotinate-nucleotide--dimethylbenzimidazole phosphoribosyltransferase
MGIGNTTSASALIARLTGMEPARIVGRGTGLDDEGLRRKQAVVEAALTLHDTRDPIEAMSAFGGFEIGAMAGVCLGGAAARVPVVVDGFVATAGAIVAEKIKPGLLDYLFFGHRSAEGGHGAVLSKIGVHPILDLGMRLGEGTGAALAMRVIESALALQTGMATFAEARVSGPIG